jgi:hypothetical protein
MVGFCYCFYLFLFLTESDRLITHFKPPIQTRENRSPIFGGIGPDFFYSAI